MVVSLITWWHNRQQIKEFDSQVPADKLWIRFRVGKLQNNYAFIDSQNPNLSIRKQGWALDFQRFRIYLKDKYSINKASIFIGYVPQTKTCTPIFKNTAIFLFLNQL